MAPDAARRRTDRERGAVFVEFVIVLPFFLFVVFLIIALSVMFSFRQAMSQAANEGARAAAVAVAGTASTDRKTDAQNAVNDALSSQAHVTCSAGLLKNGATTVGTCVITIGSCPAPDALKQCVTVALVHNYRAHPAVDGIPTNLPGFGFVIPDQLHVDATARVS
jgi:Flp pilus assembly protein TadG